MKRVVLTLGLISGVIISGMFVLTIPFIDHVDFEKGAIIGYASMLAASLLIYFGIRSYRDNQSAGEIRFGRAFLIGMLIVTVSNILYVATWEFVYPRYMPDFYDKYAAAAIDKARASGAGATDIEAIQKRVEMYKNPVMNAAFTFLEPLPVGLLVSLISAWVLSRRRSQMAAVPAG
jgi:Na+/glutamate symporter